MNVSEQPHYTDCRFEPIDYIVENGLDFLEGNVVKYVSRWKAKGGLEDLQKLVIYSTALYLRERGGPPASEAIRLGGKMIEAMESAADAG